MEAKNALENYTFQLRSTAGDDSATARLSPEDKQTLSDAISRVTAWLQSNQSADKEEYQQKQSELEKVATPILQSMGAKQPHEGEPARAAPAGEEQAGPKIDEID